ncbi:MAG: type II toxin-antitoxin system RelE family toxin [Terriglobia bacterium]
MKLRFTSDAAAEIKALDGSVRNELRKVLEKKLAVDPQGYGLPLRGSLAGYWKHQFSNHLVIYRNYPEDHVVVVCAVGVRKQGMRRTPTSSSNPSPRRAVSLNNWLRC